jgi:hypothetical protein
MRRLLVRDRSIDVGGVAVPLLLERDHLARCGQTGQERAHRVDRHVRAVHQKNELMLRYTASMSSVSPE